MSNEDKLLQLYEDYKFPYEQFLKRLFNYFQDNPNLHKDPLPAIHSIKYRMKDKSHLLDKIKRKSKTLPITTENFFDIITDLAGIRILHLYSYQLSAIHKEIMQQIKAGELALFEEPVAYTWDYDLTQYFRELGLKTQVKPSYYTSVHYVVMPKEKSKIKCEIQVRTLFEEIWGELDHSLNYPYKCQSISCKEQIKALAQLTTAGTKLTDSIIKSKAEYDRLTNFKKG